MKKAHNLRKAILIISDGGDDNGRYAETEVKNAVREADAQIYAIEIGIFDPFGPHGRLLAEFAELTVGRSYHLRNLSELADISTEIGIELRNQYVLYYTPKNQVRDGAYRHVLVELVQPRGLPPLKAFFGHGYYAPAQ
jgi:Ca-activated chloride channel family protein